MTTAEFRSIPRTKKAERAMMLIKDHNVPAAQASELTRYALSSAYEMQNAHSDHCRPVGRPSSVPDHILEEVLKMVAEREITTRPMEASEVTNAVKLRFRNVYITLFR